MLLSKKVEYLMSQVLQLVEHPWNFANEHEYARASKFNQANTSNFLNPSKRTFTEIGIVFQK